MSTILLAAGASSRMGQSKAWQDYHGQPWLAWQVDRVVEATNDDVIVVTQGPSPQLEVLLQAQPRAKAAFNSDIASGPFVSLQIGLAALFDSVTRAKLVYVLPIDVPAPALDTWIALSDLREYEVNVPSFGDSRGHPVAFTLGVARELVTVPPDDPNARLDHQLREYRSRVVPVTDPHVTLNLNDPARWAAFVEASRM